MVDPVVVGRSNSANVPFTERLARLVYWLIWLAMAAAAVVALQWALTGHHLFQFAVDRETGTSAISVTTDVGTGCQYVLTPLGGIAPRTGRDGKQVCPTGPAP